MLPTHHATITLDWDTSRKRWRLGWKVQVGRAWASHWMWIESAAEVDALTMREIADGIRQLLEARIF